MINLEYFLLSFLISITAFVYSYILTQPTELFSGLYRLLDSVFKTDERNNKGLGMHPLFKLLIGCEKCVSGQWALWIYLILNFKNYLNLEFTGIIFHLLFIGLTIFTTTAIKSIYKKHIE
jgi:hypothetical protein